MPTTFLRRFSFNRQWVATLLLLLVGVGASYSAQAQTWKKAVMATGGHRINATAADSVGNVYIAGYVSGTATFGSVVLTNTSTLLVGSPFVAKWSSSRQDFVWAQLIGGTGGGEIAALTVRGANVYVAGYFANTASFGSIALSGGGGFVAKLTDAGTSARFTWAQQVNAYRITGLATSGPNIYIAGSFSGQVRMGGSTLVSAGSTDVFVAKLLDAGASASLVWGQPAGGSSSDTAYGLAAEANNVYLTGYFYGAAASFGATTLQAFGLYDIFIAKLTDAGSSGSFTWAQRAGGTGSDIANAIAVSGNSVYVTGNFQGPTATFGSFTLTAATPTDLDMFVVKLTDAGSTGSFTWAQQAGNVGFDNPTAIVSAGPNVYVAGYFQSPTISFGSTTLTNAGAYGDVFVAKLLDAGTTSTFSWGQRGGSTGSDFTSSLAVQGPNVYVAGSLSPPATFGSQTVMGSVGSLTGYWASLYDDALPSVPPTVPPVASVVPDIEVGPNPAHTTTTVHLPATATALPTTLTLHDALGRTIHTQQLPLSAASTTAEVPLLGLVPGLYHLRVQVGSERHNRPLEVE